MSDPADSNLDALWRGYSKFLEDFDDLSLARWMAQILGQLEGKVWRLSHPLAGLSRIVTQEVRRRHLWTKRLVSVPAAYGEAPCCGAPLLVLASRDVLTHGLICEHCGGTAVAFEDLPAAAGAGLRQWAQTYDEVHDIAHWDDAKRKSVPDFSKVYDEAAKRAEYLLSELPAQHLPLLLEHYPAIFWEDADECLDVRAEDVTE